MRKVRIAIVVVLVLISSIFLGITVRNLNGQLQGKVKALQVGEEPPENVTYPDVAQSTRIITRCVNTTGAQIADDTSENKLVGEEYSVTRPDISGYIAYGEEPINKKGIARGEEIVVTFVYNSTMEYVHLNSSNNNVTVEVLNQKQSSEYDLVLVNKGLNGEVVSGGKFELTNAEGTKLVTDIPSINGQSLMGVISAGMESTETYYINETENIKGYQKVTTPIEVKLQKTWDDTNKKFVINLLDANNTNNVDIKIENGKIIVTLQHEVEQMVYSVKLKNVTRSGRLLKSGSFRVRNEASEIIAEGETIDGILDVEEITIAEESERKYFISQTQVKSGYVIETKPITLTIASTWNPTKQEFEVVQNLTTESDLVEAEHTDTQTTVIIANDILTGYYDLQIVLVDKNGNAIDAEGKYEILDKEGKTLLSGETVKQKMLLGEVVVEELGEDEYLVKEIEEPTGYDLKSKKEVAVKIEKNFSNDGTKYEIPTSGENIELKNNIVKVKFVYEKEPVPSPKPSPIPSPVPSPKPSPSPEPVNKDNDLTIVKYISKIGNKLQNNEPKVVLQNNKITFEKNEKQVELANTQEVEFTIRVYNAYGKNAELSYIYDYLPTALSYNPNDLTNKEYKWKMYDKQGKETEEMSEMYFVATDIFKGATLNQYDNKKEYKEVKIVLTVNESGVKSENRVIENVVRVQQNEDETNLDNNFDRATAKVKYFDLSIRKYISRVSLTNNSTSSNITRSADDKKPVKREIKESDIASTKLQVTYTIIVKNEGEIPGTATEIADYLPKGFSMDQKLNEKWSIGADRAVTTSLNNVVLKPGETASIDIVVDWVNDSSNFGTIGNTAEITAYVNEFNAKDITPDNKGTEDIILLIKTGGTFIHVFFIIIGIVAVVVVTVYFTVIRRNLMKK